MHIVDNAVILAAGKSSRFAPLSYETPKALLTVRGEILLERQIRQLQEAGISDIYIVVGYMAKEFDYLKHKFGVHLVDNPDYTGRNNHSSIYAVKDILKNTYICSADNYFSQNPFEREVSDCYYAAVYSNGPTNEWCMEYDRDGRIRNVQIGGENAWYMMGHTFWDEIFSKKFVEILIREYDLPETADLLWESIYINHLDELDMKIRKYSKDVVFEFDTLDELRAFDTSYVFDTRSNILKDVARQLSCQEKDIVEVNVYRENSDEASGFTFEYDSAQYIFLYEEGRVRRRQ